MEVGGIIDIGVKTKIWLRHWDKACKLCELIHMVKWSIYKISSNSDGVCISQFIDIEEDEFSISTLKLEKIKD